MSEHEFEHLRRDFEEGRVSRRRFIAKLIAGGVTAAAATALVSASPAMAAPGRAVIYGTPPGKGGTPPGQGGNPPPLPQPPPGRPGGTPPGKGGTPPGQQILRG